jgi:hypothetical protein
VLRHFENASVLIAAYEGTEEAQSAVLRVLRGEVSCTGQLPVSLDGS